MSDFSKILPLRELLGNLVPGMAIILALYHTYISTYNFLPRIMGGKNLIPELPSPDQFNLIELVIILSISYCIGSLLTSLSESVFNYYHSAIHDSSNSAKKLTISRLLIMKTILPTIQRNETTSMIKTILENWQNTSVQQGIVSQTSLDLATFYYYDFFMVRPLGEESLFLCESFVRERIPTAMIEVERNATKAVLLGNLMIPILFWLLALGTSLFLSLIQAVFIDSDLVSIGAALVQILFFVLLWRIRPNLSNFIDNYWLSATKDYVKNVILNFILAYRLLINDNESTHGDHANRTATLA